MKFIKQHDERDCGAACLAMICCHYGLKYPLAKFRELTKTDRNGVSLYGLVDAAQKLNFNAEALSGTLEELHEGIEKGEINLPLIAHITNYDNMLHYVIIYKINKSRIFVIDPDKGKVKYSIREFVEIWNEYIISLAPNSCFAKGNHDKNNLINFFYLIKNQYSKLFGIIVLSIIVAVIGIAGSFVFEVVIDGFYEQNTTPALHEHENNDETLESVQKNMIEKTLEKTFDKASDFVTDNAKHFNLFFSFLVGLYVLQAFIQLTRGYLMALLAKNIDIKLILFYYNHIVDLPLENLQSRNTGEYLSRFSDASTIRNAVSGATISLLMDSLMAIGCGVVLYTMNSKLFLISIIIIVLYGIIVTIYRKPIKNANHEVMENNAKVESFLKESIDGVDTVKSNQAENLIKSKNKLKFSRLIASVFKNNVIAFSQDSTCDMVELVGTIVILWIGFGMVLNNLTSVGSLLSFYALLGYFNAPVKNLIELQPMLQTASVAAERLNDILEAEIEETGSSSSQIKFKNIELENVDFRYGNHDLTLCNLNLSVKRGEKIAIIGESGCGKTTLVKLLMKFYDCESGSIKINGNDICEYSVEEVRKMIAYVDQSTFLFSDTIKNNLTLGNPDVSDEEIIRVCKLVQIDSFVNSLPLRYLTFLDENGRNLSGGQRQRLSIARALLRKPELLILDEATSNLDMITENAIKETIDSITDDISCIIITHRISTIKNCDKIAVMSNGTIVEFGTHEELMKKQGTYHRLITA